MNTLYVIATPIGNLEDISARALRILRDADLIAAEDTRITIRLLKHYEINTKLISYHEHSKPSKLNRLIDALSENDLALVCDSGTPGISDPGRELVMAAITMGCKVVPIPGPSSITAGISVSSLDTKRFIFLGFLPRKSSERIKLFRHSIPENTDVVFLESPKRIRKTLTDILVSLGDRNVTVCREMTKIYEEIFFGSVTDALEHFIEPRGEFTVIIAGGIDNIANNLTEENARKMLSQLRSIGVSGRDSVEFVVSQTGMPKRKVYQIWQDDTM